MFAPRATLLAALAGLTMTITAPLEAKQRTATITANDLAHRLVDEPWSVRVLDIREAPKDRIPGAQNVMAASLNDIVDDGRAIVIVGDTKRLPPNARLLAGGMAAWNSDPFVKAMTSGAPPPPPPAAAMGVIAKPKKKGGGCSS